ncbi:MAG: oligosaccharide flippase family protein [bacterium]|nr:oligosaccharide flippase family protein [bacterium]
MDTKEKIIRNTLVNSVGKFWHIFISLVLFPFIVHKIGIAAAGIWLLVLSLSEYFTLFDRGVDPSIVKYVAEYNAIDDKKKINEIISNAFFILLGIGCIVTLIVFIIGKFFITCFNIPEELLDEARISVYITAIGLFFIFPLKIFNGILRGLQRYDISNSAWVVTSTLQAILIISFLSMGYGLVTLILINNICSLIALLIMKYYTQRLLPFVRITLSKLTKEMTRRVITFSLIMFGIQICLISLSNVNRIVIGLFLTVEAITYFSGAFRICQGVMEIPLLLTLGIIPATSELEAKMKLEEIKKLFIRATKYTLALFLPIGIWGIIMANSILEFWINRSFAQYGIIAQILIIYLFFYMNQTIAHQILIATNRIKFILWYYIGVAILNLLLSIILVKKMGLIGVALGTTIPFILLEAFFMNYIFKVLGVGLKEYFKKVILKTYPLSIVVIVILYLINDFYPPNNLIQIGLYGIFVLGVYLLLFYLFGLENNEKDDIKSFTFKMVQFLKVRALLNKRGIL